MPVLQINSSPADFAEVFATLNDLINNGTIVASSETSFTFRLRGTVLELSGSGLDYIDSGPIIGTINAVESRDRGTGDVGFEMTGLDLGASLINIAIQSEDAGNSDALESLFYSQSWTYEGTAEADLLSPTAVTDDGVPVDMVGADTIVLRGGRDRFFSGGGDDSVAAGSGRDLIIGGRGNDQIAGGAGGDTLKGGRGSDSVNGGLGGDKLTGDGSRDFLFGGAGNDQLNGNAGRDQLTGGAGADVFRFKSGDGLDRVMDFQDGRDMIRIVDSDYTIREIPVGTRIDFDGGRIILAGIDVALIDENDFL